MINVVNKKTHTPSDSDVYIGRGSILGNPYTHLPLEFTKAEFHAETRKEAISKYKNYIVAKIKDNGPELKELRRIKKLSDAGDVNLVCYCYPLGCHGDIIKELIKEMK